MNINTEKDTSATPPLTPSEIAIGLFLACLFSLNLFAVASSYENWPFTPAPMFAHYIDANTPRYAFVFEGIYEDGTTRKLHYNDVGAHWSLGRFFFKYVYGSVEAGGVFTEFSNDSKAAFEKRLSKFFTVFVREHNEQQRFKTGRIAQIRLLVQPLDKDDDRPHEVGVYSSATKSFTHMWGQE